MHARGTLTACGNQDKQETTCYPSGKHLLGLGGRLAIPTMQEAMARGSQVQGLPGLQRDLSAWET